MPAGGVFLASPHKCLGGSALALGRWAERSYGSDMAKEWATACSGLTGSPPPAAPEVVADRAGLQAEADLHASPGPSGIGHCMACALLSRDPASRRRFTMKV